MSHDEKLCSERKIRFHNGEVPMKNYFSGGSRKERMGLASEPFSHTATRDREGDETLEGGKNKYKQGRDEKRRTRG